MNLYFFFNDTATTEIYTLSLHDALPIYINLKIAQGEKVAIVGATGAGKSTLVGLLPRFYDAGAGRSEEHTSELQSLAYLVCRLLLEKKKIVEFVDCMH